MSKICEWCSEVVIEQSHAGRPVTDLICSACYESLRNALARNGLHVSPPKRVAMPQPIRSG